jgi:outer membrane cobalamin receptor
VITPSSRKRFLLVGATIVAPFVARTAAAQARSCSIAFPETRTSKWAPPLDRPVSARMSVLSLRAALDRLSTIAKIRLSYSAELLPLDRAVCLSSDGQPIGRVLEELLTGTNVGAVVVGADQVVLAPRAPRAAFAEAPKMSQAPSVLDRVVVTGSAMGAPEREITVGLDVLDGRQLARDNTKTLAGALNSYAPGIWSWPQAPASMLSSYGSIRGASSFGLSYPKIYIDGIEVANPLLVSRLSMDAIDRVEVIRGPQGSALYGTDAISGVINIITRHEGTSVDGQHASVRTSGGYVNSEFANPTFTQSHALSLVSGSSTRSADLHVSAGRVGNFIPGGYSKDLMAMGSARVVGSNTTWSTTARYAMQDAGTATNPLFARTPPTDDLGRVFAAKDSLPQSIRQYTLGTTATIVADDRWTHSATVGVDGYTLANVKANSTPIPSVALQDSALLAAQGSATRGTLRASSVLHLGNADATNGTITFGMEHGVFRSSSFNAPTEPMPITSGPGGAQTKPLGGTQPAQPGARRIVNWQNSSGFTTQANAAINNTFYLTGGVRFERDSRLADNTATLPMLGAAAVRDVGPFTMKLRGAYGEGIRPPSTFGHIEFWQGAYTWNAKQSLGPEKQAGTELGLDVMLRHAWSMRVTRFDQRASGLIQLVAVPYDTTNRFSRRVRYDLENVGEIFNGGWELESSANISRLTLTGTLSFVDSRVERVANGYRGDLAAGDRMLQVPARTASANASWQGRGWFASMGATRAFDWINYDELALATAYMSGDRMAHEITGAQLRQYWRRYNGALHVRATASRDVRDLFTFEINGENLLGYQRNEPDNLTILPGRTIMTGVKLRF